MKKAVRKSCTGHITAGIILFIIVKPVGQTVKKNSVAAGQILAFFENRAGPPLWSRPRFDIIGE